jgi:uncharacterized integral membrane protein
MTQQPPEPYPYQPSQPNPYAPSAPYPPQAPYSPGDQRPDAVPPVEAPQMVAQSGAVVDKGRVRRTVSSALWVGLIGAALVLILLLIFIVQNSADVTVHYLGLHGRVPIAVALLLSAIAGLLLIAIPGTARIVQLRKAVRNNARGR